MSDSNDNKAMARDVVLLVADDDEGHRRLIIRNLRRGGLHNEIKVFENGGDLWDFLKTIKSDAMGGNSSGGLGWMLLLDIRMPGMDGVEVLERVKGDEQLRQIPVCMLTTMDDPVEVDRCHQLGCNSYIVKPVEYQSFTDTIRQLGLYLNVVEVPRVIQRGEGEGRGNGE